MSENKKLSPPHQPANNLSLIKEKLRQKYGNKSAINTQTESENSNAIANNEQSNPIPLIQPTSTNEANKPQALTNLQQPDTQPLIEDKKDKAIEKQEKQLEKMEKIPFPPKLTEKSETNAQIPLEKPTQQPNEKASEKPQNEKSLPQKPNQNQTSIANPEQQPIVSRQRSTINRIISGNTQEPIRATPNQELNLKPIINLSTNPPQRVVTLGGPRPTIIALPTNKKKPSAPINVNIPLNTPSSKPQPKTENEGSKIKNTTEGNDATRPQPTKMEIEASKKIRNYTTTEDQKPTIEEPKGMKKVPQNEQKSNEKPIFEPKEQSTSLPKPSENPPQIPQKEDKPNAMEVEPLASTPPKLKRKAENDLSSLLPINERKKVNAEKAQSIGNSSSPKSVKSNLSEKSAPTKNEEKSANSPKIISLAPKNEDKQKIVKVGEAPKIIYLGGKPKNAVQRKESLKVSPPAIEEGQKNITCNTAEANKTSPVGSLPPTNKNPATKSNAQLKEKTAKETNEKSVSAIETTVKPSKIIEEITPKESIERIEQSSKIVEDTPKEVPKMIEETPKDVPKIIEEFSNKKQKKQVENSKIEEEPVPIEEPIPEKIIEEVSMTQESNEKEGDKDQEKDNFLEYKTIRNKMMELQDVIHKVEAKMKKEELEVIALQYEENTKKSYSQRLVSLFEFFSKY